MNLNGKKRFRKLRRLKEFRIIGFAKIRSHCPMPL
jgi:hypothetical protein